MKTVDADVMLQYLKVIGHRFESMNLGVWHDPGDSQRKDAQVGANIDESPAVIRLSGHPFACYDLAEIGHT